MSGRRLRLGCCPNLPPTEQVQTLLRAALLSAAFLWVPAALGAEVAVVVSKDIQMYQSAAQALAGSLPGEETRTYVFESDNREAVLKVVNRVRQREPKVIVAVGSKAAVEMSKAFSKTPVVHLLVVNPERWDLDKKRNVYGVSWSASGESLAKKIRVLFPEARRVGMISSLGKRNWEGLNEKFQDYGLELNVSEIADQGEVAQGLRKLHNKMDLLWMGTDPTLANESAYDLLRLYCVQNKIPFLIPIRLPPGGGAVAAISVAPETAGREAARLVKDLIKNEEPRSRLVYADQVQLEVDLNAARSIGIRFPNDALKDAAVHGK